MRPTLCRCRLRLLRFFLIFPASKVASSCSQRHSGKNQSQAFRKLRRGSIASCWQKLHELADSHKRAKIEPFVIHDIRRTDADRALRAPYSLIIVRELVIAHTKPGLHKVYDQFGYLDAKTACTRVFGPGRLRDIIDAAASTTSSQSRPLGAGRERASGFRFLKATEIVRNRLNVSPDKAQAHVVGSRCQGEGPCHHVIRRRSRSN